MARRVASLILVLILAQIASASIANDTVVEGQNNIINGVKTRRKDKSTSSDADSHEKAEGGSESLNIKFTESDSSTSDSNGVLVKNKKKKSRDPKSTIERKGWRKWHRKCTKCPEDMQKKWRDPSIKWICGAYQRARRTFKSLCMMHYRNCQDGTMFTKIADHRCPNGTKVGILPYYHHFFYDYKVALTDDSTGSASKTLSASDEGSSDSVDSSELEKRLPKFSFHNL